MVFRHTMDDLIQEVRDIGCHANGDARCTCVVAQEAATYMDEMRGFLLETSGRLHQLASDFHTLTPQDMRHLANDMRKIANQEQV